MELTKLSEIMREAGIAGAGGAGFPSYAKLNEKADTIILNCAECEPLLKLHRQVLEKYAFDIMTALETVADAVGAENVIIAVKPAYKNAIAAVSEPRKVPENTHRTSPRGVPGRRRGRDHIRNHRKSRIPGMSPDNGRSDRL